MDFNTDSKNAYDQCVVDSMPIEMFPGYRPFTEPIPLHGPDYTEWTLRDLLYAGLLDLDYEGTPFVEIIKNWNHNGPLENHLDVENVHVLQLVVSWHRVADRTLASYQIFPEFPFKFSIDRHGNFSHNNVYLEGNH